MVLSNFCEKIKISRFRWPGYCSIALFKFLTFKLKQSEGGTPLLSANVDAVLTKLEQDVVCDVYC